LIAFPPLKSKGRNAIKIYQLPVRHRRIKGATIMSRDALLIARPYSQGAVPSAGEAASDTVNSICVPPGLYDVELSTSAFGGGAAPTGCTITVKEQGYLLSDPSHTVVAWGALVDARSRVIVFGTATKIRIFLRGVRITRWNDGLKNAGVDPSIQGGTTPTLGKCQVTFWPQGRAPGFNGLP
jgi:hypothetical protein